LLEVRGFVGVVLLHFYQSLLVLSLRVIYLYVVLLFLYLDYLFLLLYLEAVLLLLLLEDVLFLLYFRQPHICQSLPLFPGVSWFALALAVLGWAQPWLILAILVHNFVNLLKLLHYTLGTFSASFCLREYLAASI
jgi:hypothetical protein